MAFDPTTAIISDLAGRVFASSLGSVSQAALAARPTCWLRHADHQTSPLLRACCRSLGPTKLGESRASTIRGGACHRARIIAPQPCIRQVHRGLTMMQSCASAAKLRGGGPILENGV